MASNIQLAGIKNMAYGVIMNKILGENISEILNHHNSGLEAPSKPKMGNSNEIVIKITIPITLIEWFTIHKEISGNNE